MPEPPDALPPLKLTCSSVDCAVGTHYYGPAKRSKNPKFPVGRCRECGAILVDWPRVKQLALADIDYTFAMLQTETWRHEWFHRRIDDKALAHANRKGKAGLAAAIKKRLLTKAFQPDNSYDGRQTPRQGNLIYYGQHATATCCRKCIEYWHGIPATEPLMPTHVTYLVALVARYIELRMPTLPGAGVASNAAARRSHSSGPLGQ